MHLSQVDRRLTINIVRDTKARRDIHYSAHTQTTAHGTTDPLSTFVSYYMLISGHHIMV